MLISFISALWCASLPGIFGARISFGRQDELQYRSANLRDVRPAIVFPDGDNPKQPTTTPKVQTDCSRKGLLSRFHPETHQCYDLNTPGPCGRDMKFYADKRSPDTFGVCECIRKNRIPLLFHEETNQCYPIFQQNHCNPGQWLIYEEDEGIPKCVTNPCVKSRVPNPVLFKGKCASLFQGHRDCESDLMVGFRGSEIRPTCIPRYNLDSDQVLVPKGRPCQSGWSRPSPNQPCRKPLFSG